MTVHFHESLNWRKAAPYGHTELISVTAQFGTATAYQRSSALGSAKELFLTGWREQRPACNEALLRVGDRSTPYEHFASLAGLNPLCPDAARSEAFLRSPMRDGISILPVPLILTHQELDQIRHGTKQQIKALTKFFADLVLSPDPHGAAGGIVPMAIVSLI